MGKKIIVVTGATGNLGAYATVGLLREGFTVLALVRSRRGAEIARKRVLRSVGAFAEESCLASVAANLVVVTVDIADGDAVRRLALPPVDATWHFASSLKFLSKDREEIYRANVEGLMNMLSLHRRFCRQDARFYYISTAYVGGSSTASLPEQPIPKKKGLKFRNEYERSKYLGEQIVFDWYLRGDAEPVIMRPSVVVGDTVQGRLVNYNGFYSIVESLRNLSIATRGKRRLGIELNLDPDVSVNLIPIDAAVWSMLSLGQSTIPAGSVVNVVNKQEFSLREGFDVLESIFEIDIKTELQMQSSLDHPRTALESLLGYALTYTMPYMKGKVKFESERIHAYLGQEVAYEMVPDRLEFFTRKYLERGGAHEFSVLNPGM